MTNKQIALDAAAFLDSAQARALAAPSRAEQRRVAEAFFAACYEDLGKKPNLLDGHDVEQLLRELLPARLAPRDAVIEHVPELLRALFAHLRASSVVSQAFEIGQALDAGLDEFVEHVRSGRNASAQLAVESKPRVHGAPKLGRNDPCSCGSGKKYKKCHGANS